MGKSKQGELQKQHRGSYSKADRLTLVHFCVVLAGLGLRWQHVWNCWLVRADVHLFGEEKRGVIVSTKCQNWSFVFSQQQIIKLMQIRRWWSHKIKMYMKEKSIKFVKVNKFYDVIIFCELLPKLYFKKFLSFEMSIIGKRGWLEALHLVLSTKTKN